MNSKEQKRSLNMKSKLRHKKSLQYNKNVTASCVSRAEYNRLKGKLLERDSTIHKLENEKLLLEETIKELSGSGHVEETEGSKSHNQPKTYRIF